jgi:hypothetical protein
MSRVQHYISLIVFTTGFVLGVQIPNFIDQYSKRVDAHLIKALADDQLGGDINALILKHETTRDVTLRAEATLIRGLQSNIESYQEEAITWAKGIWPSLIHIALKGSAALRQETINQDLAILPLNLDAMSYGFIIAILFSILWELVSLLLRGISRWHSRRQFKLQWAKRGASMSSQSREDGPNRHAELAHDVKAMSRY